jgi:hypothetical protein
MVCGCQDSDLASRRPGYVEITCSDTLQFKEWTPQELAINVGLLDEASLRVRASAMTNAAFKDLEMMMGINHNPDGLLADVELLRHVDPVACMTYDWVHNMLQAGVFTIEATMFLRACGRLDITYADMLALLKSPSWCFPYASQVKSKNLYNIFDELRQKKRGEPAKLRCNASELLGLFGLLRHFAETCVGESEDVAKEMASFNALSECLGLILLAKRGMLHLGDAGARLKAASENHLRLHIAAYGTGFVVPKHHWQLDVADQLGRDGCVLDAFIIERLHLVVKAVAEPVKNTSCFERSVLSGVLNLSFHHIRKQQPMNGLGGRVRQWPGMPSVLVSTRLKILAMQADNFVNTLPLQHSTHPTCHTWGGPMCDRVQ